jgi:hypothetical protein
VHSYLRAIGFSRIKNRKELEEVLNYVAEESEEKQFTIVNADTDMVELSKEFAERLGITVHGDRDMEGSFKTDYYFPRFVGKHISTREEITLQKHAEKDSFAGVCDDVKVGVSLIFYLNNMIEYVERHGSDEVAKFNGAVMLSGLSCSGKILLPVNRDEKQMRSYKEASINRNNLIAAARDGDEEAIESLTLEDIDLYTMISRRILREDLYTLVDSSFMPYGIECDQYSVIGEILDCQLVKNSYTEEEIYLMTLECNELIFDVCINKADLIGEPEVGRRFKGSIWMQGKLVFEENNI